MVAYIIFHRDMLAILGTEISPAYQNGNISPFYLTENCPRLDAVLLETLRVTNGALSARGIVVPTQIRSKVLRSGNSILIPLRQLHYEEAIFGDDPARWDLEQFLRKKILRNSSSFKLFRGEISYYPRHFLAR